MIAHQFGGLLFKEKIMKLLSIWQFPQIFLGMFILEYYKATKGIFEQGLYKESSTYVVRSSRLMTAVSLGNIIIIGSDYKNYSYIKEHEYGHSIQSRYLGIFYLFTVGIMSLIFNIISRFSLLYGTGKFSNNYYKRWPENQADSLGGVKRLS